MTDKNSSKYPAISRETWIRDGQEREDEPGSERERRKRRWHEDWPAVRRPWTKVHWPGFLIGGEANIGRIQNLHEEPRLQTFQNWFLQRG